MALTLIRPTYGGRGAIEQVTVGVRKAGRQTTTATCICVSKALAQRLGWPPGCRVAICRDDVTGELHITPSAALRETWTMTDQRGSIRVILSLPGQHTAPVSSVPAPHEIEGGTLVVRMPTWAGGDQRQIARPLLKAGGRRKAHPHSAEIEKEDLREATVMIGRGDTTATIMEHFGWSRERVENLRRTLAAVRRAA